MSRPKRTASESTEPPRHGDGTPRRDRTLQQNRASDERRAAKCIILSGFVCVAGGRFDVM